MNVRVFACLTCKAYIDAGYRWCAWHLEDSGLVADGNRVDVVQVLAHQPYWDVAREGGSSGGWLEALLPRVRQFLTQHELHEVRFGDTGNDQPFHKFPDCLDWDEVDDEPDYISAQTLCDVHQCRSWEDVQQYMKSRKFPVHWWDDVYAQEEARRRFNAYVTSHCSSDACSRA